MSKEIFLRKITVFITAGVCALACSATALVVPAGAAAASLDGETLAGATGDFFPCQDNSDGTSSTPGRYRKGAYDGVAAGPVVGTFQIIGLGSTFSNTTGLVTSLDFSLVIAPADGSAGVLVYITLGSGQGVGTCAPDGSWTLNVTGATYTVDGTGDTGVVSFSATNTPTGGTFTALFGPQLPTSKDQCKKGGWQTFPGFKNQGDCVSYVASKGKNKPAGS